MIAIQEFSHQSAEDLFKGLKTLRQDIIARDAKRVIVKSLQRYFGSYGDVALKPNDDHYIITLDAGELVAHVARAYVRKDTIFFAAMNHERIDNFFTINGGK